MSVPLNIPDGADKSRDQELNLSGISVGSYVA